MIHLTASVSEEVNRKCHTRNVTIQLSILYADPEHQNTLQTGGYHCQQPIIQQKRTSWQRKVVDKSS